MSQSKLAAAREFIQEKNYRVARVILECIPNDPTAKKWLQKLDEIAPVNNYSTNHDRHLQQPISYEYKTVKISFAWNYDRAMNDKIYDLTAEGWEFISYTDEGVTNAFGMRVTNARILSFRRLR